jgi:poly(A) polymerase
LRILRFFRFTAAYTDGALDADGLVACLSERDGLARVSAERIQTEFLKLLVARHALAVIDVMAWHGLITDCIGAAEVTGPHDARASIKTDTLARLLAIEKSLGLKPHPILRLAALIAPHSSNASSARAIANKLRLSNADKRLLVDTTLSGFDYAPAQDPRQSRRALWSDGRETFQARVLLRWAQGTGAIGNADTSSTDWANLYRLPDRWTPPPAPLTGADLIAAGIAPGPTLGTWLAAMQAWWIELDFKPDRTAALAELAKRIRAANGSNIA